MTSLEKPVLITEEEKKTQTEAPADDSSLKVEQSGSGKYMTSGIHDFFPMKPFYSLICGDMNHLMYQCDAQYIAIYISIKQF